ncbi:MAG: hypothetical protein JXA37_03410 [Chloroflexia bacterium]|nr:hypothetical protein [Chloroflexia bacterium]
MRPKWIQIAALLLLLLGGLLLDLHLQGRPAAELDVGGRDLGFVRGFSSKEWGDVLPGPHGPETETYRWMGPHGILHIGTVRGGPPLLLHLRLLSGRPAETPPPQATLRVNDQVVAAFALSPLLNEYAFILPPTVLQGGALQVELEVETFQAQGDDRELGLIMERARLETLGGTSGGSLVDRLAQLRPAYTLIGLLAALTALALELAFGPAWGCGAGLLALAGLAAAWKPESALRAGPTLLALLLLGTAIAGGLRLLSPHWRRWARWLGRRAEWVLLVLFLLGLPLAFAPHIEADGVEYYAYLRSLAFDGDLHFANELSLEVPFAHVPYGLGAKKTATGYEPNYASVGPAIAWAPLLPAGHLTALAGHALGLDWTLDGYSEPYVVWICFGSTLSALASLLLGYDLLRRLYGSALGLLSTLATFFGAGLFYYAFYKPDFAHALAACAATVFVYLWHRSREVPDAAAPSVLHRSTRQWFWLGLAAGFMSTLYWIDALLVLLPAAEVAWEGLALLRERHWRGLRNLSIGGGLFALAFTIGFFPQMLAWKILFGQWFTVPQEGFATPQGLAVLELLLSPLHGLLPWTPIAALGLLGLLLLAWEHRPWGSYVLLAMGAYFLYNATLPSWHGGGTFGLRRLVNAYPLFLLGVGALLQRLRRWRPAAAALAAFLPTLWGLVILLRYLAYTIPHYPSELENLSLGEFLLAPDHFPLDRLPAALELAWFWQWGRRLLNDWSWPYLLYGLVSLGLFVVISWGVWKALRRRRPSRSSAPLARPE